MSFDIMILVETVVRFFFILLVGYVCTKCGLIRGDDTKRFSHLILCVAQPFMIVSALIGQEFAVADLLEGLMILGIGLVMHGVLAALAFACAARFSKIGTRKMTEFCIIFANVGFFGLPLIRSALGAHAEFLTAFYVVSYNIVVWTYGMYMLGRANPEIKMNPKKVFLNFGTVPSVIGIVLYAMKGLLSERVLSHAVTRAVLTGIGSLSSLCTPISLLIIGALLSTIPLKKLFSNPRVYYANFVRLVVSPLLVFFLARLCGLSQQLCMLLTLIGSVPTAANAVMFAESYDIEPEYASAVVGIGTVLSTATIPVVCWVVNFFL